MIFVTTGTQEPFDRLLKVVDDLAAGMKDVNFVVQSLHAVYVPKHFKVLKFITSAMFESYVDDANLIISHAGMGTIITALAKGKPIVVMPRLLRYNEHRNEHQLATAKEMDALLYVDVAYDEQELKNKVLAMWPDNLRSRYRIGNIASQTLLSSIDSFIKY